MYNKRFSRIAANQTNVHVKLPRYFNINSVLCIKIQRSVRNDGTVSYQGRLYQIRGSCEGKKSNSAREAGWFYAYHEQRIPP